MSKAISLLLAVAGAFVTVSSAMAQDAAAGEKKAVQCIGCHGIVGYQASFPQVYKVPKISGQNEKYIVAALNAYRKGERRHPTMRAVAGAMTDADIADVAAYYHKHGESMIKPVAETPASQPSDPVGALLTKGACASCHGPNYSKPIDGSYPKIAGQHADYLYVALRAYGTEGQAQHGRANAIMAAQVKQFSPAELKAMAGYLATLPGEMRTIPEPKFR